MPPLPSVPGVTRAIFHFSDNDGHTAMVGMHHHYSGGTPGVPDVTFFAQSLALDMKTLFQTVNFSPDAKFEDCVVTDLSSPSGASGSYSNPANGGGSVPTGAQVAALVNLHIHRRYRGGKPKYFLPFLSTSALSDESHLTTTAQGNILSTADIFAGTGGSLLPFTSGAITWDSQVNVSYFSGFTNYTKSSGRQASKPTVRSIPLVDTIYAATVPFGLHTQRRRLLPS